MKRHAFLAMSSILLVSVCLWAGQFARDAWSAPSDGTGPDDTAPEYALTAGGDETARGTILFEYYWGTDGTISSLEGLPTFPDYPDDREWRASLQGPTDWRDHYGTYVRGYLYPPATGNYTFWIASDDQSQLWLSTDENPAHIVQIASVSGWTAPREFGKYRQQQKSRLVSLTAGKRYYIEALHADGTGDDNLAVAWQGPDIPERTIIAGKYLSPVIGPQDMTDANLLGWWKLDETSGTTAADSSGKVNNGTVNGTATWTPGHKEGALRFDGAGTWVECGGKASLNVTDGITIAAWIRMSAAGRDQKIAGNQDGIAGGYKLGVYANDKVEFEIRTAAGQAILNREVSGGTVLQADTWYLVTGVYSPGEYIRTYVNGQLDRELTTQAMLGASTGTFKLGREPFVNLFFWSGPMDDVRVYDRALLPGEIRWLTGLFQGEYFTNVTLSGSPALTRLDSQISVNWGDGEVFPGALDLCSIRWTGEVEPAFTEPYTFYVNTDDGARLWLDDNLIIDAWWDQAATEHASAPIQLIAGQKYPLRLEWYENTGLATCELRWSSPSTPKQVISAGRQQRPGAGPGGNATMTLNPTSGPVGTTITITGSGYAASTDGDVISPWVSKLLTTTPEGTFSTTVTVPENTPGGDYPFAADFPLGGPEEAPATFTVTSAGPAPSVTVSPTSGPVGAPITISGSGFAQNTSGNVTLAGTSKSVTTTPTGVFSTTMTVPSVSAGNYPVHADIPSGGSVEASATFTVTTSGPAPGITVSPTSGPAGTTITAMGSGFAANASGNVTLAGASKSVTTSPTGTFSTAMTVPSVSAGNYPVQADIPSGGLIEASATFTVTASGPTASMTLSPTSGPAYTTFTVAGSGFATNTSGRVFMDGNRNNAWDSGEPYQDLTTTATGTFPPVPPVTLSVPVWLPFGPCYVYADFPRGSPSEAWATFWVTVPKITVDPASGPVDTPIAINGSGFAGSTNGTVFFDGDGDGICDPGEPSQSVTTAADGTLVGAALSVPSVERGDYPVQADIPSGGSIEANTYFTVPPILSITVSPTSSPQGTTVEINFYGPWGRDCVRLWLCGSAREVHSPGWTVIWDMDIPWAPGKYRFDVTSPCELPWAPLVASAAFTITRPTSGPSMGIVGNAVLLGTTALVTIDGTGFPANASGNVTTTTMPDQPGQDHIFPVTTSSTGTFEVATYQGVDAHYPLVILRASFGGVVKEMYVWLSKTSYLPYVRK